MVSGKKSISEEPFLPTWLAPWQFRQGSGNSAWFHKITTWTMWAEHRTVHEMELKVPHTIAVRLTALRWGLGSRRARAALWLCPKRHCLGPGASKTHVTRVCCGQPAEPETERDSLIWEDSTPEAQGEDWYKRKLEFYHHFQKSLRITPKCL